MKLTAEQVLILSSFELSQACLFFKNIKLDTDKFGTPGVVKIQLRGYPPTFFNGESSDIRTLTRCARGCESFS
jgi:hypothetical protein